MPTSQLTVSRGQQPCLHHSCVQRTTALPTSQLCPENNGLAYITAVSRGQRPLSTLQLCPEDNGLAYITAVSREQRPCLHHSCVQRTTALPTSQLTVSRGQRPCLYHSCLSVSRGQQPCLHHSCVQRTTALVYITAVSRGQRPCLHHSCVQRTTALPTSQLILCLMDNRRAYMMAKVPNGHLPCPTYRIGVTLSLSPVDPPPPPPPPLFPCQQWSYAILSL